MVDDRTLINRIGESGERLRKICGCSVYHRVEYRCVFRIYGSGTGIIRKPIELASRFFKRVERFVIIKPICPVGGRIPVVIKHVHIPLVKAHEIAHHVSGIVPRGTMQRRLTCARDPAQKSPAVFLHEQFYYIQISVCGAVYTRRPAVIIFCE